MTTNPINPFETKPLYILPAEINIRVHICQPQFLQHNPSFPHPINYAVPDYIQAHRDKLDRQINQVTEEHKTYLSKEIKARQYGIPNDTVITAYTIRTQIILRKIPNLSKKYSSCYELWNGSYDLCKVLETLPSLNLNLPVFIKVFEFKHIDQNTNPHQASTLFQLFLKEKGIW